MLDFIARVIGCMIVGVSTCASAQPQRLVPAAAAKQDAALARRAIELIHPGLDRYTANVEIDAAFDRLELACDNDITERDFYAQLSLALARIRCSHTKAEPSKQWNAWRSDAPTYLPFRFVEDDGRMIVIRPAIDSIRAGDEVVSIDGVPSRTVLATILAAVPADGWTDNARRFSLSSSSDLDESELDHFLPAFFPFSGTARLELRSPGDAASRVVNVPMMTQAARRAALNEPPTPSNLDEAVALDLRPGAVAVLRVGTFVAYRKQIKPADIYRPFFERIAAEKINTLILDLRDNGGGSDSAAIDLARFLVGKPFALKSSAWVRTYQFGDLAERLETWDRSMLSLPPELFKDLGNGYFELLSSDTPEFSPLEPTFNGRLIILCGPANASGSTLFIAGLREQRPVTLVGEPTGGSAEGPTAGVIFFLPLLNTGIRVRIPAIRSVTGFSASNKAGGLDPDIIVRQTIGDRLVGRDAALLRALELAEVPSTPSPAR